MKCTVIIDPKCEESVIIYARKRSRLTDEIERLTKEECSELFGYKNNEGVRLDPTDISLFTIIDTKLYAIDSDGEKYLLRERLCAIENLLPDGFVKINQSTVANIREISKFGTSFDGSLYVMFKNGYRDYVSRRQISNVKRALKIKKEQRK